METKIKYLVALIILVAAGLGTTYYASTVMVTTYSAVSAEVVITADGLVVTSNGISVAASSASATGTVDLKKDTPSNANTAITAYHWIYSVTVAESSVNSVTSGTFTVELFINDVSQGQISLEQTGPDANKVESTICKWDIGTEISDEAVYLVKVTAA